jgi:hypothetical protein
MNWCRRATADDGVAHEDLGPQNSSTSDEQAKKSLAKITTDREAAQAELLRQSCSGRAERFEIVNGIKNVEVQWGRCENKIR